MKSSRVDKGTPTGHAAAAAGAAATYSLQGESAAAAKPNAAGRRASFAISEIGEGAWLSGVVNSCRTSGHTRWRSNMPCLKIKNSQPAAALRSISNEPRPSIDWWIRFCPRLVTCLARHSYRPFRLDDRYGSANTCGHEPGSLAVLLSHAQ